MRRHHPHQQNNETELGLWIVDLPILALHCKLYAHKSYMIYDIQKPQRSPIPRIVIVTWYGYHWKTCLFACSFNMTVHQHQIVIHEVSVHATHDFIDRTYGNNAFWMNTYVSRQVLHCILKVNHGERFNISKPSCFHFSHQGFEIRRFKTAFRCRNSLWKLKIYPDRGVCIFLEQTWIRARAWWIKRSKSFKFSKTCWNWPFLCSQGRFVVVAAASPSSQPSFQDTFLPDMLPLDGFGLRVTWRVAGFVPLVDTRVSSDSSRNRPQWHEYCTGRKQEISQQTTTLKIDKWLCCIRDWGCQQWWILLGLQWQQRCSKRVENDEQYRKGKMEMMKKTKRNTYE